MKKELRKKTAALVSTLEKEYCTSADLSIRNHILNSPEYKSASVIFCYVGTSREINTMPLILQAISEGKRIGVPLCKKMGIMEVREIRSEEDLVPGAYDILAPKEDAPLISPEEIELCLVPCMTCNHNGERLGYGGGFYDRFLARTTCPKMMLCREKVMTEEIPTEPHDLIMESVVSEAGIFDHGKLRK